MANARLAVIATVIATASAAHASQDHYSTSSWVGTWPDAQVIVVEMIQFSPEAEGKDLRRWWSLQTLDGVEQARIDEPFKKRAKLRRPATSTIAESKLVALVDKLRALASEKPRLRERQLRERFAADLAITALVEDKPCPVRVRVGATWVTARLGTSTVKVGRNRVRSHCIEEDEGGVSLEERACYAHAGGHFVTITLKHHCEGDSFFDRFVWMAPAPLAPALAPAP